MASMEGVWAKFHRAAEHADAFDLLLTRLHEDDSYSVAVEFERRGVHLHRRSIRPMTSTGVPSSSPGNNSSPFWSKLKRLLDACVVIRCPMVEAACTD